MHATTDLVAVIIPTYNSGKFIQQTIQSVLAQVYRPIQIICVDDGSSDDTIPIIQNLSSNIEILHHRYAYTMGAPHSRNLGLSNTSAAYVAFLDHDDIWYPNKISEQIKILKALPNVALVHTNGYAIDENNNILYDLFDNDFREPQKPEALLLNCYIILSSVVVRRNIFKKVGYFDEDIRYASDHDMWLRIKETAECLYLPDRLIGYRRHSSQLSERRSMWEVGFTVLDKATKRYSYGDNMRKKRLAVLYYRLGNYDFRKGDYCSAVKNLLRALSLDPARSAKILYHLSMGKYPPHP